jgi:hypothetical protein
LLEAVALVVEALGFARAAFAPRRPFAALGGLGKRLLHVVFIDF